MVKAKTNTSSWQHLYRALLRSSSASVRFSRPAARNTRRYLRDEFASWLAANQQSEAAAAPRKRGRPKLDRSSPSHGGTIGVAGGGGDDAGAWRDSTTTAPTSSRTASLRQLLQQHTHNTLAFHLSASLLPSAATKRHDTRVSIGSPEIRPSEPSSTSDTQVQSPPSQPRETLGSTPVSSLRTQEAGITKVGSPPPTAMVGKQPTASARLAHRVLSNLSSLTYHHLSPHTQMQSRAHLKDNRALRKPKPLSSLARVLGKLDATPASPEESLSSSGEVGLEDALSHTRGETTVLNEAHMKLGFLLPTVKPKRGPISARLKEWDGQDTDKIGSEGVLRQMEADLATVERLLAEYDTKRSQGAAQIATRVRQLKTEAEQLKKKIKMAAKALAQAESQRQLENIPIQYLADLVAAAQDKEGILLGKNRWLRRKNGDFLPP